MTMQETIARILAADACTLAGSGPCVDCVGRYQSTAEDIVAELALRQEWMVRHESGGGIVFDTYDEAKDRLENFVERPPAVEDPGSGKFVGIETRYVSTWNRIKS